jgi:hypothetical protein
MKRLIIFCICSVFIIHAQFGESLWDSTFPGYLSKTNKAKIGDIVTVSINSDFSLSFVSSSTDSKQFTLEFSGGQYPDLFSFIPLAKSGDATNLKGREDYSFKSDVVTRIARIEGQNLVFIQGSKTVAIDGKSESVTISGFINPQDIGTDKKIPFSKVADSRLTLKTLIEPSSDTLTQNDIEEVITDLKTETQGGSPATATQLQGTPTPGGPKKFSIKDPKKKELFFRYINKLIDIIF